MRFWKLAHRSSRKVQAPRRRVRFEALEDRRLLTTATELSLDGGGNLLINDVSGVSNALTIQSDATNQRFVVHDAGSLLGTTIPGAGGHGTSTVTIPFTSVPGGSIVVNAGGGDDTLTVDFSLGDFSKSIAYNGGWQSGAGDTLALTGGSFRDVSYGFLNRWDGNVVLDGQTIQYTGLEPIFSSVTAANVTLGYSGASETINVSDAGAGQTTVSSTAGETVTFANPSDLLTLHAGDGNDVINVLSLATGYASVVIDGQDGFDSLYLRGDVDLAVDNHLDGTADFVLGWSDVTASGTGSVHLTADRNLRLDPGASITTESGSIVLEANTTGTAAGSFTGIVLSGADLGSVDGAIHLRGHGGTSGWGQRGILVFNDSTITSTGEAPITLEGTGGTGDNFNIGVQVLVATVTSVRGDIRISGQAGSGGSVNIGTLIQWDGIIESTGTDKQTAATITIEGQGGGGSSLDHNHGVEVRGLGTRVASTAGDIQLIGQGGDAQGSNNLGVVVWDDGRVASRGVSSDNAASIRLDGTAGDGVNFNRGVVVFVRGSVESAAGDILLAGTGSGSGSVNTGVEVSSDGVVQAARTGAIAIQGTGGGDINANHGVHVSDGTIAVHDGNLEIAGTGTGTGFNNYGVLVEGTATLAASGLGSLSAVGQGTPGISSNMGIRVDSSTVSTNAGDLSLEGTGGDGSGGSNRGIFVHNSGASVTSQTGDVSLLGVAGSGGTSVLMGVQIRDDVLVASLQGGDVTIAGTGGVGTSGVNYGVELIHGGTAQTSGDGRLSITGVAGFGTQFTNGVVIQQGGQALTENGDIFISGHTEGVPGFFANGIVVPNNGLVSSTGTGDIHLVGTGGSGGPTGGIGLFSGGAVSSGGGDILLEGATTSTSEAIALYPTTQVTTQDGDITVLGNSAGNTALLVSGIDAGAGDVTLRSTAGVIREVGGGTHVSASDTTLDGEVAPGGLNATSRLTIDGNVAYSAADAFTVELNGSAPTSYDQLRVEGAGRTVELGGATLNVSLNFAPAAGDQFVIIDNVDAASTVSGTFAGLAEGDFVGGTGLRISYQGGDGNDVVLLTNSPPELETIVTPDFDNKGLEGSPVSISGTFSDADGNLDTHTVLVDWGDGTPSELVTVDQAADSFSGTHTYAAGGIYEVTVTVTDELGLTDTETSTAVVSGVGLDAASGTLSIIGTSDDDRVTVNAQGNGTLKVHADFLPSGNFKTFDLSQVSHIVVYLCAGDDHLNLAGNVTLPVVVHAGDGNDHVNGGGGPLVALGGAGDDTLHGGSGRDILIGGTGHDQVAGDDGQDVLIGGDVLEADDAVLLTALAGWNSGDSYEDRAAAVDSALTVLDDQQQDWLTGDADRDLFFDGLGDQLTDVQAVPEPEWVL